MVATRACERSPSECASLLVGAQLQMLCAGQKGGIRGDEVWQWSESIYIYNFFCISHKGRPGKSAPSDFPRSVMMSCFISCFTAGYVWSAGGHKILRIYESTAIR